MGLCQSTPLTDEADGFKAVVASSAGGGGGGGKEGTSPQSQAEAQPRTPLDDEGLSKRKSSDKKQPALLTRADINNDKKPKVKSGARDDNNVTKDCCEEIEVTEEQLDLMNLDNIAVNPSQEEFQGNGGVDWLGKIMNGAEFEISMTAPIAFACRCFTNTAILMCKDTDYGNWAENIFKARMSKLQDGISSIRVKELG